MISATAMLLLFLIPPATARARSLSSYDPPRATNDYWKRFAIGAGTSLLAHESAHFLTALALGFHPHIGFDKGRPTVYSGIDSERYPHKQFLFSAAGLTTQALIDEAILDIPHSRGGARFLIRALLHSPHGQWRRPRLHVLRPVRSEARRISGFHNTGTPPEELLA